jgi:predicted negative regulator of RcsB-dependent stress response
MKKYAGFCGVVLIIFALIAIIVGGIFTWQGLSKTQQIKAQAVIENVQVGLSEDQIKAGEVVDTIPEFENAANTITEHKMGIAKTYKEALDGKKYDPTNPKQLTYAQAMNLENALRIGMISSGLALTMIGHGLFYIMTGVAFLLVGIYMIMRSKQEA